MTLKCAAQSYANPTQDCGLANMGTTDTLCNGGGACISQGAGSPATCIGAVDAGSTCDTALGPPCLQPARCVVTSGTSGTCMLLDATMCNM